MGVSTRMVIVLTVLVSTLVSTMTAQTWDANGCYMAGGRYDAATDKCVCKDEYDGIGDICCARALGYDVCYIKGDPTLRSVNYQRVSLNVPCSVCVNVMHGETADNKGCVWEVLSTASIGDKGSMYNSMVNVAVSINKASPTYFTFDGNRIFNIDNNREYYLGADGRGSETYYGETFQLFYDAPAQLWSIEGCQNKLVFRPKKEGVSATPGLYMQAPKGSTKMSLQQGNLCNLEASYDANPWKYGVLNNALTTRLIFNRAQKASDPAYDTTCSQVDDLMGSLCQGISGEAMLWCGPILYNSDVRYCLDAAGIRGNRMAGLFHQCLEAYCDGASSLCNNLKNRPAVQTCLPSLTECNQWPYYYLE